MKDLEMMTRMEELEEQLELLHKLEEEEEELVAQCKHNMIVVTYVNNCYSIEAECLFCGRKFTNNRELYDCGAILDINEYYPVFWDNNKMIAEVKTMYKDIVSQNGDLHPSEISKMIKEKFKNKYQETKEILEESARSTREDT